MGDTQDQAQVPGGQYACWGAHAEDLTDRVREELKTPGELTFYYRARPGGRLEAPRQVFVTCSEGHVNRFDLPADGGWVIRQRGRPPTAEEQRWLDAGTSLTPERSLERTTTLATLVFTNVAVVGTLLAALGTLGEDAAALRSGERILGVPAPVALAGASLLCATVAVLPSLARVNPTSAGAVERWYVGQIRRRAVAVIAALVLFAAAIVTATLAATDTRTDGPRISLAWTDVAAGARLVVKVQVEHAPVGALAETEVRGIGPRGRSVTLLKGLTPADARGAIDLDTTIAAISGLERVHVLCTVRDGRRRVGQEELTLRRS